MLSVREALRGFEDVTVRADNQAHSLVWPSPNAGGVSHMPFLYKEPRVALNENCLNFPCSRGYLLVRKVKNGCILFWGCRIEVIVSEYILSQQTFIEHLLCCKQYAKDFLCITQF